MAFMFWLFFAMLIPVWIPVTAVVFGSIADAVNRRRGTHALTGAAAIVAQLHRNTEKVRATTTARTTDAVAA